MTNGPSGSPLVEKLLASMTLEEKVGQLIQYFYFDLPDGAEMAQQPRDVEAALDRGAVGSLLFITDPAVANRMQERAIEGSRQGIPALLGFDVIHGLRTIFPVPIALAAAWDAEAVERAQTVAAREARAVGIHWVFAPMVDIARDPRWGRMVEGAGEDPYLGAVVAAAQVRGFQGDHIGADEHVIAGPKHFAGYGAATGGRDYDEVDLSDQEFWNTYLPPFRAAVEAGAGNIMSAYMDLNGVPATGNRWLLTDVLRDALGFDGFVVSDANSVKDLHTHHFATDATDAGVRALSAGLDLEMAISEAAFEGLTSAVGEGRISEERIDESVRRLLRVKEQLGLFDDPFVDEARAAAVLADPVHRDVARTTAERTAVLLRNQGALLPLSPTAESTVAVIGPLASSRRDVIGPWAFDFDLDETVSILEGIKAAAGEGLRVAFAPGVAEPKRTYPSMFEMFGDSSPTAAADFDVDAAFDEAVRVAAAADVAVVVLGEQQDMIGENASRSTLELPGDQQRLLEAVAATGTPVVLVLMSGRPLDIRWAAENVAAILEVWYPGTKGGEAVANLLFGAVEPQGRLPFSWPRSVGQVPMPYSHTRSHDPQKQDRRYWNEESTPLYPFGFGLGYGSFTYSAVSVDRPSISLAGSVEVSATVTNTSDHAGSDVAQLYIHQRSGTSSRPSRLLKGFKRVHLEPGASTHVTFSITEEDRRYWSAATRGWVTDMTVFEVGVGSDAAAPLTAEFEVTSD
jgi:beta-glucosidase